MYKIIKSIEDILSFDSISSFGISKTSLIDIDNSVEVDKIEATNIYNLGNYCILLDQLNKPKIYLDGTWDESLYNEFRVSKVKFPYLNFYTKESSRQYGIFDVNTKQVLLKTDYWIGRDVVDNFIFGDIQGVISCRHVSSTDPLWSFSLSSLGTYETSGKEVKSPEVHQFIGIYDEKLWVRTDKGHFFGLDINSGALLYQLKGVHVSNIHGKIDEYLGETDMYQFFFRNNYILDTDRGVILGLGGDRFFEIDIKSENPSPSIYGMFDQMKTLGIKSGNIGYNQVLSDNKLYFIAYDQGVFGIIDTITKNIDYVSDPIDISNQEGRWPQLKEIQVSNNKVYVLTSDNVLHIYQKEI